MDADYAEYARQDYIADCLWVIAASLGVDRDKFRPFTEMLERANRSAVKDEKSGTEIIDDIKNKLRRQVDGNATV